MMEVAFRRARRAAAVSTEYGVAHVLLETISILLQSFGFIRFGSGCSLRGDGETLETPHRYDDVRKLELGF
jgi:hypothetical protein